MDNDDPTASQPSDEVLTAMAHPLRRRLLDVLKVGGAATASVLADRTDQRVGNISHHLKVLDLAGLITEDPSLAKDRRERWWRFAGSISWASPGPDAPASTQTIAGAAEAVNIDVHAARVRDWLTDRHDAAWIRAAFANDTWMSLTSDELALVSEEINAVMRRWAGRTVPNDDQDRRSVFVFAHGVPAKP